MSMSNFYTYYPDGKSDESYTYANGASLNSLTSQLDQAKQNVNSAFTNAATTDTNGNPSGLLINRLDNTQKFNYSEFTPSDQNIEIQQYTFSTSEDQDQSDYTQCTQDPDGFSFGNMCILNKDIQSYTFTVDVSS